MISRKK